MHISGAYSAYSDYFVGLFQKRRGVSEHAKLVEQSVPSALGQRHTHTRAHTHTRSSACDFYIKVLQSHTVFRVAIL